MRLFFGCILASIAVAGENRNDDAKPPELPPVLLAMRGELNGKTPQQVREIVTKKLGPPTRYIGSGILIPQWAVADGFLTVHPGQGPTFTKNGLRVWLIETKNRVGPNIVGDYEMTTPADPANHGTRFWIGNLHLRDDGTYQFTSSNSNNTQRDKAGSNFFFEHPHGKYAADYPEGITAETLLEKLPNHAAMAKLHFADANDGNAKMTMAIRVDTDARRLDFASAGDKALNFEMDKGWQNYWK